MAMTWKQWIIVLAAVLLALFCAVALADTVKDESNTAMGVGKIGNPKEINAGEWKHYCEWSYVYYGYYNGTPVKYRVLDRSSGDFGISGGSLLLDCDTILFEAPFDSDNVPNAGATRASDWSYSDIRKALNGSVFLNASGVFTDAEKAAIGKSYKSTRAAGDGAGDKRLQFTPLNGDKIFLLDNAEASRTAYGYMSKRGNNKNESSYSREKGGDWMLRSHYYYNGSYEYWETDPETGGLYLYVDENGRPASIVAYVWSEYPKENTNIIVRTGSNAPEGISPAFNVALPRILFSTQLPADREYKLTLLDDSLLASITAGKRVVRQGRTLAIPYTVSGAPNRLSLLIRKVDGGIRYYRAIDIPGGIGSSGTVTATLPEDWAVTDRVYLVAEKTGGDHETDRASAPLELDTGFWVTFDARGGAVLPAALETKPDGRLASLPDPCYDGHQFSGWFTAAEGGDIITPSTVYSEDCVVYAHWVEAEKIYYRDIDGAMQSCANHKRVLASDTAWTSGWYTTYGTVTLSNRPTVSGTVNLILRDGATLNAPEGIRVPKDAKLIIWAQFEGTGKLSALLGYMSGEAAIGGNDGEAGGTIIINGGSAEARSYLGAGIGGGNDGEGGAITINSGTVTAESEDGAGIGGGWSGAGTTITINRGDVTAKSTSGAGIGGGKAGNGGTITISGGTVTAESSISAGIGGGQSGDGGTITISGGMVNATGQYGAGIGGGYNGNGGSITISGGTVNATVQYGAGIGGGYNGNGGSITISGGTVNATGEYGAGIGGGEYGNGGSITISGGTVTAESSDGAGIGGGCSGNSSIPAGGGGTVRIIGGRITARSKYRRGIGPGYYFSTKKYGENGTLILDWSDLNDRIQAKGIQANVTLKNHFLYSYDGENKGELTANKVSNTANTCVLTPYEGDAGVSIKKGDQPLADGENLSLLVGDVLTLTAEAASPGVGEGTWTWRSDDPAVANVSVTGAVTALLEGETRITAEYRSGTTRGSASVTVTVNGPHDITVTVENGGATVAVADGEATAEPQTALPGQNITLTFTPEGDNTVLKTLLITCEGENVSFEKTDDYTYTFDMPEGDVLVTAGFCQPTLYSVTFMNSDGTKLQWGMYEAGKKPEYTGETPICEPTAQYAYAFAGWDHEIEAVTDNAVYTATYTPTTRKYLITFVDWDGTQLGLTETEYGKETHYWGNYPPVRPDDGKWRYTFRGWTPEIATVYAEATYRAEYDATRYLSMGDNTIQLSHGRDMECTFTPESDGWYVFHADQCPKYFTFAIFDGEEPIGNALFNGNVMNCAAELEGGKTYVVYMGGVDEDTTLTLNLRTAEMHDAVVNNADPNGAIEISNGNESCTTYQAYEGQLVEIIANSNDDYALAALIVKDSDDNIIEETEERYFYMPDSPVTVTPVFDPTMLISISLDPHVRLFYDCVEVEGLNHPQDNARVLPGKCVVMTPYCESEDYAIGTVEVVAADGTSVRCRRVENEEEGPYYWFIMPEQPVSVTITSDRCKYVRFDPGDGTGEMETVFVDNGLEYSLPQCGFDTPAGQRFKAWSVVVGEAEPVVCDPEAVISVAANTVVTALWTADYTITIPVTTGGTVTATINGTTVTTAHMGDSVTLTTTATEGYTLDELTVTKDGTNPAETVSVSSNTSGNFWTFTMPDSNVTVTATWTQLEAPKFAGYDLTLNGILELRYYVQVPTGFDHTSASMTFSVGDRTVTVDCPTPTSGIALFTCPVYAYEMGDTITATLGYGTGETLVNTCSVETYLKKIINDTTGRYAEKDKNMASATLTYGKCMLVYLDDIHHWNGKHTVPDWNGTASISAAQSGVDGKFSPIVTKRDTEKISRVQFYLNPNDDTKLNFEIKLNPEITGEVTEGSGLTLAPEGSNTYRLTKTGIGASNLATEYPFVLNVSGVEAFNARASVMTYVKTVLGASDDAKELNAMAALYEYYTQAESYQ